MGRGSSCSFIGTCTITLQIRKVLQLVYLVKFTCWGIPKVESLLYSWSNNWAVRGGMRLFASYKLKLFSWYFCTSDAFAQMVTFTFTLTSAISVLLRDWFSHIRLTLMSINCDTIVQFHNYTSEYDQLWVTKRHILTKGKLAFWNDCSLSWTYVKQYKYIWL